MKKLITCLMLASLLVFSMAGAASAQLSNSSLSTLIGSSNATTYSLAGVGSGTLWRPATFTTTVTQATLSNTVLGTKGGSITFNAPGLNTFFNWTNPAAFGSGLTATQAFAINSAVSPFIGYLNQGTAVARALTTAITGDSTWASKVNTATFSNLYTPPPVALTASTLAGGGLGYALTAYPVPGDMMSGYQVGQLEIWKFIPAGTTINNGAKTANKYSLATSSSDITGTTDGQIWFTSDAAGATLMSSSTTFATSGSSTYYMWMLLRDNGNFDMDGTLQVIVDPPTVTPATSSGSSSSGCVYNPAAGLSLDLLFLALPALGVLASRIRRK